MKTIQKLLILAAALTVLLTALTACGGASDSLKAVQEKGVLVGATSPDFPPFEYLENGEPVGVEIELMQAIAEKLRVPVVSIAGGAPCDGSEMVDMDTFGVMPKPASHAKSYTQLLPFLCEAYMGWLEDVREGEYPQESNGYHMDPQELEKFNDMMDKFEG